MGSIIGHRIDYNRVGGYKGLAAHTQQKLTQVTPPPPFPPPGFWLQFNSNIYCE